MKSPGARMVGAAEIEVIIRSGAPAAATGDANGKKRESVKNTKFQPVDNTDFRCIGYFRPPVALKNSLSFKERAGVRMGQQPNLRNPSPPAPHPRRGWAELKVHSP
jgi:hypothetical protein